MLTSLRMSRTPAPTSGPMPGLAWFGRLCALLALAVQLATASVVPFAAAATLDGIANAPICHAGNAATDDGDAPAHRSHACVLCPLCQAVAQAGAILGPSLASVPQPLRVAVRVAPLPPARAPPVRAPYTATSPRGPPAAV